MARLVILELAGFAFEHFNKFAANDLAFGFRLANALQVPQKLVSRVYPDHLGVQFADKHLHHHVAFVQAQQAMVNKDTGQLVPNGTVNQRSGYRRIDATRQPQNHLFRADLGADFFNCLRNIVTHDPVRPGATDVQHKALQNGGAALGVCDFRVKLHPIKPAFFVSHAGNRAAVRAGHQFETMRQLSHLVAMTHPHLQHAVAHGRGVILNTFQELGVAVGAHVGVAKLPFVTALYDATQLVRHGLHAVANAQHWHTQLKHRLRRFVSRVFIDTGVATRQDDAFELAITRVGAHPIVGDVTRMNFTKDVGFTDAAGNQLGDLRAEVEDQNFLVHYSAR